MGCQGLLPVLICRSLSCRVNWIQAKVTREVKEGDVISCSGKGRIEVVSTSLTKKGRHAVEMTRYV